MLHPKALVRRSRSRLSSLGAFVRLNSPRTYESLRTLTLYRTLEPILTYRGPRPSYLHLRIVAGIVPMRSAATVSGTYRSVTGSVPVLWIPEALLINSDIPFSGIAFLLVITNCYS